MKMRAISAGLVLAVVLAAGRVGWAAEACDSWMPFNEAGKWGFVEKDAGKVEFALAPAWDMAYPFRDGRAAVKVGALWGFIDGKGRLVILPAYEDVQRDVFRNGVAVVKKGGLWGVIDVEGKEILPAKFRGISLDEKEGRLVATVEDAGDPGNFMGLSGLYDLTGKEILPVEYTSIYGWFKNGVTAVEKGKKRGLVTKDGKMLTGLDYDQMYHSDIADFIAVKEKEGVTDVYDGKGKLRFSVKYPYVGALVDGRAMFKDGATKKNGYLDENGKVVIAADFVMGGTFSEGLAVVQRATGGAVEVIDVNGKSVGTVKNAFIRLDKFKNGTVWLADRTDKKLYLYNTKLERVFPQGFYYAGDFDANGLSRAQAEAKKNGLINMKGEWVVKPEWTGIEASSVPGLYVVSKDKEKGIINAKGEVLLQPQAVSLEKWDESFVKIAPAGFLLGSDYFCFWRKDGVYFYVEKKGG